MSACELEVVGVGDSKGNLHSAQRVKWYYGNNGHEWAPLSTWSSEHSGERLIAQIEAIRTTWAEPGLQFFLGHIHRCYSYPGRFPNIVGPGRKPIKFVKIIGLHGSGPSPIAPEKLSILDIKNTRALGSLQQTPAADVMQRLNEDPNRWKLVEELGRKIYCVYSVGSIQVEA